MAGEWWPPSHTGIRVFLLSVSLLFHYCFFLQSHSSRCFTEEGKKEFCIVFGLEFRLSRSVSCFASTNFLLSEVLRLRIKPVTAILLCIAGVLLTALEALLGEASGRCLYRSGLL
ncbi:hypothetical protein L211DRAFT_439770 [Terfezia boudieri ATCC MYA-4762]|uniref:Uncharacterized protein n=1 Tax=Terfezia boudieri ATCC MYA-4762 TaxID=1051890 RepID=A0A3N4LLG6_9PEZI|nr:hypothetical protein L211DRAFT_439770 [Terfezia boudieri ATCC MYA-4762]